MNFLKMILAAAILGNASLCLADSFTTTISSLNFRIATDDSLYPSDPPGLPTVLVITPTVPDACKSFPFAYLLQLTDLTNDAQKQVYATLVSARLNNLQVGISFVAEPNLRRCRITGVSL